MRAGKVYHGRFLQAAGAAVENNVDLIAHLVIDVLSVCKGVMVISRHQRGRQYRLIEQIEKVPGDIVIPEP